MKFNDYYYHSFNVSRSTPSGIAAYRSALTLDWLAAEDIRQREMVAAIESEPEPPSSRISHSECIDYARPPSGTIARFMLEMLRNLEGDDGMLIPSLVQALVRSKLLVLESSVFENEPDLETLVKTPSAMLGEPHTTFPRVLATVWMAVTDPSTVKKQGWCTVNKVTSFLSATRPSDIAKHMRVMEPILARARFIMEEFIQHVTPLNLLQKTSPTTSARQNKPVVHKLRIPAVENVHYKRPVRTHTISQPELPTPKPTQTAVAPLTARAVPTLGWLPKLSSPVVPGAAEPAPQIPKEMFSSSFTAVRKIYSLVVSLHVLVL